MRTLLLSGACLSALVGLGTTSHTTDSTAVPVVAPSQEYTGVYISSPDEDYFTPCGVEHENGGWSLKFRDDEPQAPFLKKVTALRGYASLTHFIRVRGSLGPPGSYNFGFQRRQLSVDSVLEIKESLEPCAGFGVPAGWSRMPPKLRNSKGIALSNDRKLAAVIGMDGRVTVWSTETGTAIRTLGTSLKANPSAMTYGPLAFSEDGKLLAIGGSDGLVRVWRPRDGRRVFSLKLKDSADVAAEMAKSRRGLSTAAGARRHPPTPILPRASSCSTSAERCWRRRIYFHRSSGR